MGRYARQIADSMRWLLLFGLTASGWNGVFLAEVARLAPQDRIGETTGAVLTASYAGLLVTPVIISAIETFAGLAGAFVGLAILAFVRDGGAHPGRRTMNAREIAATVLARQASAVETVRDALDRIAAAESAQRGRDDQTPNARLRKRP